MDTYELNKKELALGIREKQFLDGICGKVKGFFPIIGNF